MRTFTVVVIIGTSVTFVLSCVNLAIYGVALLLPKIKKHIYLDGTIAERHRFCDERAEGREGRGHLVIRYEYGGKIYKVRHNVSGSKHRRGEDKFKELLRNLKYGGSINQLEAGQTVRMVVDPKTPEKAVLDECAVYTMNLRLSVTMLFVELLCIAYLLFSLSDLN